MRQFALVVVALGIGWGAVELTGRLFGIEPVVEDRIALYTSPNWSAHGRSLRWAADARIRTVGVYGDRIEYDTSFETNDLGYIDHRNYGPESAVPVDRRWAFVGDSFTAGYNGGEPWVPTLRDQVNRRTPHVEIYNLGVSGVGLIQFLPNLSAADRVLDFGNVVFLLISDDLERKPWRPVEREDRIVLCPSDVPEESCAAAESRILVLRDREASPRQIFDRLAAAGLITTGPMAWLERRSIVAAGFRATLRSEPKPSVRVDLSDWLARLSSLYPDQSIHFLQIPEKGEVRRAALRIEIGEQVRAAGHHYVSLLDECDLQREDYFDRDPHLRAEGNTRLRSCVGRALGLL